MPSDALTGPVDEPRGGIGYVVKVYPRFSETFIVTELLAREAAGERLTVFALRPSQDPRFHPELARVAAPVRYLPRPSRPSALWEALREAEPWVGDGIAQALPDLLAAEVDEAIAAVALAQHARRERLSHLHAHFATSAAVVARLASRIAGIPYSFTAHAKDLFHESVDPERLRTLISDAAYAATVSAFNVRFLRVVAPAHADRIRLVPNAIEVERFPYRAPRRPADRTLRIAAVGRLVEKKGFRVLLDALAALRDGGVDARLTLAGDGELAPDLRRQTARLGLSDRVRMPGPLPQDEVSELLRASDVFVAPCIVGSDGNADGLPTVLLEAMATGVPCVSTSVTGIPEVVVDGETGIVCPPGDALALAHALRRIAEGEADVAALSAAARELVERRHDARAQARAHAELTAGIRVGREEAA